MNRIQKAAIISFSLTGGRLAEEIRNLFAREEAAEKDRDQSSKEVSIPDVQAEVYALRKYAEVNGQKPALPSLSAWCGEEWKRADLLIFVGASGIAVRTIAPYVKSKVTDPAVLVIDEGGNFVISLLSGHLGGANEWAQKIAAGIHAQPVITTATDVEGLFAVDVWAKKNNLAISSMKLAKEVSADLLHGKTVYFDSEIPWTGKLPKELTVISSQTPEALSEEESLPVLIWCGLRPPEYDYPGDRILWLLPRCIFLGVGCRKGKDYETIKNRLQEVFDEAGLSLRSIDSLASIDLKKEEDGLIRLADWLKVPFYVFSSDELALVEGDFTPSSFVSQITGVDNVCERSAIRASGGSLLIRKQAGEGVTIAAAQAPWRIEF